MIWLLALLPLQDSWLTTFQASEARLMAGDVEGARAHLEHCLELEPEHATTAYHLAMIHAREGREDDAIDWLERAVEWGYADDAVMAWDPDLVGLPGRPRFEELISRLSTMQVEGDEGAGADVQWIAPSPGKMSLSRAGALAVTDGWGETLMWDTRTWDLVAILDEGGGWKDCAPAPGGRSFAVVWAGSRPRLGMWDAVTGRALWEVKMPSDQGISSLKPRVRFSEDGELIILQDPVDSSLSQWLVHVSDGHIEERQAESEELELAPLTEPTITMDRHPRESSRVSAIVPIGDSMIAMAIGGSDIRLADISTTRLLSSRRGGVGRINTMDFVEERALLVLGGEERTEFFDLRSGSMWNVSGRQYTPSPDGHSIAIVDGNSVLIVDLRTRRITLELPLGSRISCLEWSHAGDRLAVGRAREVRIFYTDSGTEALAGPILHPGGVIEVSFRADDRRIATAAGDYWMRIWDTATGELLAAPNCSGTFGDSHVEDVLYTANGRLLLAVLGDIPDVEARDPESLDLLWSHSGFGGGPNWLHLQLTKSGRLLCGAQNTESRILVLTDGSLVKGFADDVTEVIASPGEDYVYTIHEGAIDVLDGKTLEKLYTRVEFPDEGELVFLPSLYCRGTPEALRNTWLIREGRASPMASLAAVLYDPKRVAAGAAGIPVRPAALETK